MTMQTVAPMLTAAEAHTLHRELLTLREEIEARFVVLGRLLCRIRDTRAWEALGHDSMSAYLASPEMGLSVRHCYRVMEVVDGCTATVADVDLIEIGVAKAELIAPVVRDAAPEEVAALVADAKTLSRSDLRKRVADLTRGTIAEERLWIDELGDFLVRRAARLGRSEEPLKLLDEIVEAAMQGVARLKGEQRG